MRSRDPIARGRVGRRGFTLVELMVALVVGAIVVLGARQLVDGVADGARRVTRAAARADRDANAERTLRAVVGRLEIGTTDGETFGGDASAARFTSWCDVPAGWQERCAVTLRAATAGDGRASLVVERASAEPLVVRAGLRRVELRYLADTRDGGRWFRVWGAGLTAPIAIGVVMDADTGADTLLLRIGERG